MLTTVLLDDEFDQPFGCGFIQVVLPCLWVEPSAGRSAKDDAVAVGEEHLGCTAGVSNVGSQLGALVYEAYVANSRSHMRQLPGAAAPLVISPSIKQYQSSKMHFLE